jgi:hypothetical protein
MKTRVPVNREMLNMALVGYILELNRLDGCIEEVEGVLKSGGVAASISPPTKKHTKHVRSVSSRKKMAAAQRKRRKEARVLAQRRVTSSRSTRHKRVSKRKISTQDAA